MDDLVFILPGDPQTLTGGYGYDRRLKAGLEALGWRVRWMSLPGAFPRPDAKDLEAALAMIAALPAGQAVLADGLAYGVLPMEKLAEFNLKIVALTHHPLALETGLSEEDARIFAATERSALAAARGVLVTSGATAETLIADFGVPRGKVAVAEPGVDRAAPARGGDGATVEILSVGTVTKRKGHALLIEALGACADLKWRCRIVGSLDRDPDCARAAREAAEPLKDRILFEGETGPDAIARFYDEADLFVLPSFYEGYGMAFAEALAHGLPIVGFATGAVPSFVPKEAGLLVPVGNIQALAAALRGVLVDASLRRRLAEGAFRAAQSVSTWDDATAKANDALKRFLS